MENAKILPLFVRVSQTKLSQPVHHSLRQESVCATNGKWDCSRNLKTNIVHLFSEANAAEARQLKKNVSGCPLFVSHL